MDINNKVPLKEAAELTGFSVSQLRTLIRTGVLPASRRGVKLLVIDRTDLAALDTPITPNR